MPIYTNEFNTDKEVFYTERFKTLVRSQKELLVPQATTISLIEDQVKYAYRNDFYRLLRHYKVPAHLYWTVAFINGVTDPFESIIKMKEFLLIDENVLYELMARSGTTKV